MRIATWVLALAALAGTSAWANVGVKCAREGEYCKVDGTAVVRYGAGSKWAMRRVRGGVKCDSSVFGDPIVGVVKSCFADYSYVDEKRTAFIDPPTWTRCAKEGGECLFPGRRRVSYGAGKNWIYKVATYSIVCSSQAFGKDPAVGVNKHCYYDSN